MKYFITTPIYYVNAKPHIGHIYTNIASDVLARHHRRKGDDVLFSTGTDENSQKNVEAAHAAGQEVRPYVDAMAGVWRATFEQLGFSFDRFIRTTEADHVKAVHALLAAITQAGDIYEGDYEGLYCAGSEDFVNASDLVDGLCPHSQMAPQKITEKNYFFKLTKYRQPLLDYYAKHKDFVQPLSARNKMLHYIEHEMADVSISRQSQQWGIRLPQNPEHAIYVWFDALINYLTVAGYPTGQDTYWPAAVHLIGKDIIKFHCAIWPAMLMSAGLPLPQKIFAHGFFTIDGQKISKSLGNAVDPLALIKEYPFDAIRYYLLRDIPFGSDGDFSHERLKDRYNADLANGLGNLVSRTLNMIELYLPDYDGEPNLPEAVVERLSSAAIETEMLAFDKALTSIWSALAWADGLIETNKPWQLARSIPDDASGEQKQKLTEILAQLYATLVAVNEALAPYLPETYEKLSFLLKARPLKKPAEPLFARK